MLSSLVIDKIGVEFSNQLETQIELVNGLIICVVNVSKSTNPAFLSGTGGSEFFVRVFNTSRQLDSEQPMNYLWHSHLRNTARGDIDGQIISRK